MKIYDNKSHLTDRSQSRVRNASKKGMEIIMENSLMKDDDELESIDKVSMQDIDQFNDPEDYVDDYKSQAKSVYK
jgi:hypothetical protein